MSLTFEYMSRLTCTLKPLLALPAAQRVPGRAIMQINTEN